MNNAIDITAAQRKIILALLRKHLPNTTAWVYGSRATWNARPQSDLDMVVFTTQTQERGVSDLRDAFEESALPFRVDLFVWDTVPESFHKQIEAEHVVLVEKEERVARDEWRETALGKVIELKRGYDLPHHKRNPGLVPVVSSSGPTDYHSESKVQGPGVVTGRYGTLGQVFFIPNNFWPLNTTLYVRDFKGNDPRFISYFLRGIDFSAYSDKAAVPGLNRNHLHQEVVRIPIDIDEQRAIAHILGTLDDKIELNRRMNETLEEMARALFKSWFVDFDPVHAKATLKHHATNQAFRQGVSAQATKAAHSGITPPLRGSRQAKGVSPQARRRGEIRRLYSPQTLQKAQALRHNQTDAEGLLWHYLRNKQLGGYKFRRQQPIGPYIADFACLSQKLLIELDGSQHATQQDYDEKRDAFLRERGYRVLRFWNNEVFENCFGVLERIYAVLPHHPPLEGGSKDGSLSGRGNPPPQQPAPDGLAAATPPQGGSDWTVGRARAYLDGMDADIAALFPDRFVDSELGEIPEGWEVCPLGEAVETVKGRSYRRKELIESDTALVTLKSFARGGGYRPEGLKSFAGTYSSDQVVNPGEIVIACTDVTQAADVIGRPAIVQATAVYRTLVASLDTLIVRPSRKCMTRTFLYFLAISDAFVAHTYAHTTGTTVLHLAKNAVPSYRFIQPPTQLVQCFDDVAKPLLERIQAVQQESDLFTGLRDTLLPKLISGELRVKGMKKALEQD